MNEYMFALCTYVHYLCMKDRIYTDMPRPKSNRIVYEPPIFTEFKPVGIAGRSLKNLFLSIDEFEAIRLADYICLSHEEAAEEMEISRSTFTRLIEQARKKVADFIVQGKLLTVEGGNIHFRNNIINCLDCGHMFKTKIGITLEECPECKSKKLLNLAAGFGHGKCCVGNNNHKNQKK
jgi:predicted DNA-binding protein (UPF0251 family)